VSALLRYDFLPYAAAAGVFASVACGIVGTLVVSRRMSSIAGGIAHASFGGVGLGFLLGIRPALGALIFGIVAGVGIGVIARRTRQSEDTVVGIIWAVGMSIGILCLGLAQGYAPDLFSYLFGNILTVAPADLVAVGVLDAVVLAALIFFRKELLGLCFDEEFTRVRGVHATALYLGMLVLIACTVVVLIKIVGIILVIALLTIPPATARRYVSTLGSMMALAAVLCAAETLAGLAISYYWDIPSGAAIILLAAAVFVVSETMHRRAKSA